MQAKRIWLLVVSVHIILMPWVGVSWDEPLHRVWGAITLTFVTTWNIDVIHTMPGLGENYGPAYHALNFMVSNVAAVWHVPLRIAIHVLNVASFATGVALTAEVASAMHSRIVGLAAAACVLAMPQLLAHAHYNAKDIPLMAAGALILGTAYKGMRLGDCASAARAGAACGVALAIKVSAVLMVPAVVTGYVIHRAYDGEPCRVVDELKRLLTGGTAAAATTFLLWPSLWLDPGILWRSVTTFRGQFFPGTVFYLGTEFRGADLPWHYTVVSLMTSLPVPLLLLFVLGASRALYECILGTRRLEHAFVLGWIALPLLFSMVPGVTRYDGFRQFFFTLPAVAILAACGAQYAAHAVWTARASLNVRTIAVTMACVALCVADIVRFFPYTGEYFNQVLPVLAGGNVDRTEVELWGAPYQEGVAWLNDHASANASVCVPVAGHLARWYILRRDVSLQCDESTDYIMYIRRIAFMNEALRELDRETPQFEIRRGGARLLAIHDVRSRGAHLKQLMWQ